MAALLQAIGESKWDTDTWDPGIPPGAYVDSDDALLWESDGGLLRGYSNTGVWTIVPDPVHATPPSATFTLTTTYPGTDPFSNTCTSSNPQFTCQPYQNSAGLALWSIAPSQ